MGQTVDALLTAAVLALALPRLLAIFTALLARGALDFAIAFARLTAAGGESKQRLLDVA